MNRRGTRYSYDSQDYEDEADRRTIDRMFTGRGYADCRHKKQHQHRVHSRCQCGGAGDDASFCPCAQQQQQQQQISQVLTSPVHLGGSLDTLDIKQMLLFASVGVLFVLAIDGLVRLVTSKKNGAAEGAITIEGRTYVPL